MEIPQSIPRGLPPAIEDRLQLSSLEMLKQHNHRDSREWETEKTADELGDLAIRIPGSEAVEHVDSDGAQDPQWNRPCVNWLKVIARRQHSDRAYCHEDDESGHGRPHSIFWELSAANPQKEHRQWRHQDAMRIVRLIRPSGRDLSQCRPVGPQHRA